MSLKTKGLTEMVVLFLLGIIFDYYQLKLFDDNEILPMIDRIRLKKIKISEFINTKLLWEKKSTTYYHNEKRRTDVYKYLGYNFILGPEGNATINSSLNNILIEEGMKSNRYYDIVKGFQVIQNNFLTVILDAQVTRVEFFWDIEVKMQPRDYILSLIPKMIGQDTQVFNLGDTLYIKHTNYELKFYNKSKQTKQSKNILRYELTVKRPKHFFSSETKKTIGNDAMSLLNLTPEDFETDNTNNSDTDNTFYLSKLLEEDFMINIQNKMWELYDELPKEHIFNITDEFNKTMTAKEFKKYIYMKGIEAYGGEESISEYVMTHKSEMKSKVAERILNDLEDNSSNPNYMKISNVQEEMDKKFKLVRNKNVSSIKSFYNKYNIGQFLSVSEEFKNIIYASLPIDRDVDEAGYITGRNKPDKDNEE
jgi:hypothetical protein